MYRQILLRQDQDVHNRRRSARGFEGLRSLLREFSLARVEGNGQRVCEEQMQHGVGLMLLLLQPYIRK